MNRINVDSSNLQSVGYDSETKTLEVQFNYADRIYHYLEVPQEIFDGLMAAESKGKFLQQNVKNRYEYELITESGG